MERRPFYLMLPFPGCTIVPVNGRFCIVKGNEPKSLPGCYGIFDRYTGQWYIGQSSNVRMRRLDHEVHSSRELMQLHEVMQARKDYSSFVFVPLFYITPQRKFLRSTEEQLIRRFGSVSPTGYNAYESLSDPIHWKAMNKGSTKRDAYHSSTLHRQGAAKWLNTPEAISKRALTNKARYAAITGK